MATTNAMDEVDYSTVDFNASEDYDNHTASLRRHPPWLTEGHFVYHLYRHPDGRLGFVKDKHGEPLCSPRKLSELCQHEMVCAPCHLETLKLNTLPADLYPRLLNEAVLQRQLKAISYLVSTWPFKLLHVQSIIPTEELLCDDFLTVPLEGGECMSLMDSFIIGLLNLKPHSQLRCINFAGFRHDRRLCQELLRLPLLWMKPGDRQAGYLHSLLRKTLSIGKDKVQRYLKRISSIYSIIDVLVKHGINNFGPITVVLDCKLTADDVPIGLALQHHSPFRFLCQRAWCEVVPDVCLPLAQINKVLEPRYLTHLEVEDAELCAVPSRWESLLEGLEGLPELKCLSLPNSVHVTQLSTAASQLGKALTGLVKLRKVNLASCTLRDSLDDLLPLMTHHLTYLNLRDCRLTQRDIQGLLYWGSLKHLRELNLSRNSLHPVVPMLVALLSKMSRITCFAISYCSLSLEGVRQVVRHAMDCGELKVLCVQSFIPPPVNEVRGILEDCANIPSLQKCVLLPEAYAFPGTHISQRTDNHEKTVLTCLGILDALGRSDIELV